MTRLPSLGPRGEGWVLIQGVILVLVFMAGWSTGPDWSGSLRFAGAIAGVIGIAGGAILATRGLVDLRTSLTPLPYPRDDATLVVTGVYAHARHPIYGGLILASFGWAVLQAAAIALLMAAILGAFFWLKSFREEAWLTARFPDYPSYRQRTRRFIPWIY
jgi:protein-S-isoprenylcysteine O-methyltransferase Ste14